MESLKLTSLWISEKCLQRAEIIASGQRYWKTSEVLRLAIWLGLQIMREHSIHELHRNWIKSELGRGHYDIHIEWHDACSL